MTRTFTIVFQIVAGVIQFGNYAMDVVPAKYKWIVALVVGIAQAFQSQQAHFTNPDGTPASTPYKPA